MLQLLPDEKSVCRHQQVLQFASGLSHKVGAFLCLQYIEHHIQGKSQCLDFIMHILRENEAFVQDMFRDIPSVKTISFTDLVRLRKGELQSLRRAIHAGRFPELKKLKSIFSEKGELSEFFGGYYHIFTHLETIFLSSLHKFSVNDLQTLGVATTGKLPRLRNLDIRGLDGLFWNMCDQMKLSGLQTLRLICIDWTTESLGKEIKAGKLL